MLKSVLAILALAVFAATAVPATQAAVVCGPHAAIAKTLAERFNEGRRGIGLAAPSQVIELYVSPRGTWTMLSTDTRGQACVVGAGEAWQSEPERISGLDS